MRIASIDLGTNTFNLLIAEAEGHAFKIIFKDKRPVKLGKGGINKQTIQPDAWERGIQALSDFKRITAEYHIDKVIATATSAIRCAENGQDFVEEVKTKLGISITTIDGKEEARLIFEGVKHAVHDISEPFMVMDIGGGSVEFIIAENNCICWHNSFEVGMARMLDIIKPSDPISSQETEFTVSYLKDKISSALEEARRRGIKTLVGSSGSFDALANMASYLLRGEAMEQGLTCFEIPVDTFQALYLRLVASTLRDREKIPGMDMMRIEMIVLGTLLIHLVCQELSISRIIQSEYAIKEGVILNSMRNDE
ncbi:MAG: phosphatase [Bacteroidetes bacterium HGW-Bacteroidetes-21]|jgi:exopolyphosphatase/guanosine-5'-triphosphate,3'-diphosphate pyrophosphatase|nr:MAG: phosphatase [Bacteroidetes bacterium HGW-Bacteroidetes-21]